MSFKLDIFDVLRQINVSNQDVYSNLTEEEQKAFAPLVVMRWLSGANIDDQILYLNKFVNPYVFPLGKHPHLLMQLMQVCGVGKAVRCNWLKQSSSKKKKTEVLKVLCQYYEMTPREVNKLDVLPSNEDIIEMAEHLGWQKAEIAKLKKEMK
jgi:hypothetical protein